MTRVFLAGVPRFRWTCAWKTTGAVSRSHERAALGLLGMEERVTQLGGRLRVSSEPGRGTVVVAELPL